MKIENVIYVLPVMLLIVFASGLNAETVYKTVDENGRIIFTDKPSENSEEIKLDKLQTIKNPNPGKFTPLPEKPKVENRYNTFLVTNPANDSGLRNNAGNVSISLSLEPGLHGGDKVIITMDGKEIAKGSRLSVSVSNIDRGTHSINARVVDVNGKTLISASSSFSLLRTSQ